MSNVLILIEKLKSLQNNPSPIFREAAQALLPEIKKRVHQDGKDSSGNQIGTYSPEYMKVRTGNYKNAETFKKGAKKGELKNAGKYTKGLNIKVTGTIVEDSPKKGLARPRYNRTADTKVILSLTRQMENDTSIIQTANGYGIGYLNHFNYKKAIWSEATYKKPILTQLTNEELELVVNISQSSLDKFLTD